MSLKDYIKQNPSAWPVRFLAWTFSFLQGGRVSVKGQDNQVLRSGCFLKKSRIVVRGNHNRVVLDGGFNRLTDTTIYISGDNNEIVLGRNNNLNKGELWIEDQGGKIVFGNNTSMLGFTHVAVTEGESITFGDGCLFAPSVIFRVGDSHPIFDQTSGERVNPARSISVGNHVWFGNNTTILKGVQIKDGSVVATGAIVTKSPEEGNVILAGNPAKVVKSNIDWQTDRPAKQ